MPNPRLRKFSNEISLLEASSPLIPLIKKICGVEGEREPEFSTTYRIDINPKIKEAMECLAPTALFVGPWGSGKTRLLGEKAYYLCQKYPKYKSALVRKKRVDLKATTWKFLIDKVIPKKVLDASYYNKQELEIKFPNGSEIHGSGLIEGQKLASTEYGFIGVEEAIEILLEEDFNWIEGRARDPECLFHQVMFACNAGPPSHYLYRHFFMDRPKDQEGNPLTQVIEGEILWEVLPASYRARLSMLKGKYRERFVENKWIGYEGLIYDCFNPAKHVVSRFPIPRNWSYVVSVDFGFNSPFVSQLWAVSPDDVWYLDKEIYHSHRTINQHSPLIKALMEERNLIKGPGNRVENSGEPWFRQWRGYSDHDSEDQATLVEHGIMTQNADKNVSSGIQKVYEMMANDQIFFFEDALIEKDPILEMLGKPTCTIEEIQGYLWANNQKDQPKKENDHGMDAKRYGIQSYYGGSVKQVVHHVSLGISVGPQPELAAPQKEEVKVPEEFQWVKQY